MWILAKEVLALSYYIHNKKQLHIGTLNPLRIAIGMDNLLYIEYLPYFSFCNIKYSNSLIENGEDNANVHLFIVVYFVTFQHLGPHNVKR
jgi:hypothetical protein